MALAPGARLGPYEVVGLIGAGGMGGVYKARDTRLDRTVAVKVLPAELAADPERRQRLEREAKTISQLTHPHICTLYDIGTQDGTAFLVMEYLEGETLAARLARSGRLPVDEALRIGAEVADALAAAHKHGVIHRDLKPANVMLTKAGAKLLDFGLAKLKGHGEQPAAAGLASMTTRSGPLTAEGTIVGTLQYMAPEQVEGKPADARSDLWALGAMLYEMLTGQRAFAGESAASLITAIMSAEPPTIATRQPLTPPALDRLVRKCLAKAPDDRWESAHDVADELRWIWEARGADTTASSGLQLTGRRTAAVAVAVLAVVASTAVLTWLVAREEPGPSGPSPQPTSFDLGVTPADHLGSLYGPFGTSPLDHLGAHRTALTFSPAGDQLVYTAFREGTRQLFLRVLTETENRPIPGTEGGVAPFFSPDGRFLGFWAEGEIKRLALDGGPALTVCSSPSPPLGATWTADDRIVFGGLWGLLWVPASGGDPAELTTQEAGEGRHRLPQTLPDGNRILFTAGQRIVALRLDSGERVTVLDDAQDARYVPTGHLLFMRQGFLTAAPFDAGRVEVTGEAVALIGDVMQSIGVPASACQTAAGQFAVSNAGALAYILGGSYPAQLHRLGWVDRDHGYRFEPVQIPVGSYLRPRVSPDGRFVVVTSRDAGGLWLYDVVRQGSFELVQPGPASWPLWGPDGSSLVFSVGRTGLYRVPLDGSTEPELLVEGYAFAGSWAPDGTLAFVLETGQLQNASDIWTMQVSGEKRPLVATSAEEEHPEFSPDGSWLTFQSDHEGGDEVYVQPYPGPGRRQKVSTQGGLSPAWSPLGDELFYRTPPDEDGLTTMMAVSVTTTPTLQLGQPQPLFTERYFRTWPVRSYDVSPDGRRFLILQAVDPPAPPTPVTRINLVVNWFEELKAKVPAGR